MTFIDLVQRFAMIDGAMYRLVEYVMLDRETHATQAAHLEVYEDTTLVGTCFRGESVKGERGIGRRRHAALRAIGAAWTATPFVLRCDHCRDLATRIGEGRRNLVFACDACHASDAGCVFVAYQMRPRGAQE